MRILFVNQYFPPDPAPTGILFVELADYLRGHGHEVDFVSAGQQYRAGQGKGGRVRREAFALCRMLGAGIGARRADVVISGSSPPCALVAATMIAARHRARSFHWAMDLYPELAVALGEVPPGRAVNSIAALMGWCYRRCEKVVALDADMAAHLRSYGITPEVIRPWVFTPVLRVLESAGINTARPESDPWVWIYSGNLGRAHEWETLLEAQAIIERQTAGIRLRFQGGGPSWPAAKARAEELGLKNCEWQPYVDETELPASLLRCQVLAVTQRPEAQALLWPSKLGLLLSLPRPVLWVGPIDCAIARDLRAIPHTGVFDPGQAEEVAQWVLGQHRAAASAVTPAVDPAAHREDALQDWAALL